MCLVKKCALIGVLALLLRDDSRGRCKFMTLQFRGFGGALFKTKNGKISFVDSEKIKTTGSIGTRCYRCSQGLRRPQRRNKLYEPNSESISQSCSSSMPPGLDCFLGRQEGGLGVM